MCLWKLVARRSRFYSLRKKSLSLEAMIPRRLKPDLFANTYVRAEARTLQKLMLCVRARLSRSAQQSMSFSSAGEPVTFIESFPNLWTRTLRQTIIPRHLASSRHMCEQSELSPWCEANGRVNSRNCANKMSAKSTISAISPPRGWKLLASIARRRG